MPSKWIQTKMTGQPKCVVLVAAWLLPDLTFEPWCAVGGVTLYPSLLGLQWLLFWGK